MLGAAAPLSAAAPVALPLEVDGSRLWSSRRQGTSLLGLLRFHGIRHVELDQLPKLNEEIERRSPKRLLLIVGFGVFQFPLKRPACLFIYCSVNQMLIKLNGKKSNCYTKNNDPR